MTDAYTDAKFAFMDEDGNIRLVQAKSMTMAKANRQEESRVFKQLLEGRRRLVNVVSCVDWTSKFND